MDDCIEWRGSRTPDGYGTFSVNGKNVYAHRNAYCEHHGVSLDSIRGLVVRHMCDNPPCFNPKHLVIGTHADNSQDMVERGRAMTGEKSASAKLTEKVVERIFALYIPFSKEYGVRGLARMFNVSNSAIRSVLQRKTWACVEGFESIQPQPIAHPRGISWHKSSGKWQVRVKVNGKSHYVGVFKDEEDAKAAYRKAAAELRAAA